MEFGLKRILFLGNDRRFTVRIGFLGDVESWLSMLRLDPGGEIAAQRKGSLGTTHFNICSALPIDRGL